MITGKHKLELKWARNEAQWLREEYALLLVAVGDKNQHIRELQGHAADLDAKLDRYERCATPAVKKKVAELDTQNEAELKAIGEQAIKDGKY